MGEVYLAQDARLGRRVALKVLRQGVESGEIAKRRFGQEAQTASALNHPNIVSIFDVGHADGLDFIAMEYVEGRLASKRERRLTNESGVMPVVTVSPDGKWVVYQCVVGRTIDLHAAPNEGGDPRIVVSSPLEDYHPAVSPSGRCLYYLPDHENLYRVPGPAQDWRSAAPEKVTDFSSDLHFVHRKPAAVTRRNPAGLLTRPDRQRYLAHDDGEGGTSRPRGPHWYLLPVLRVADVLHPIDGPAVEPFLNSGVRHRRRRRGAVPMLRTRRDPDQVTRSDLLGTASSCVVTICRGRLRYSRGRRPDEIRNQRDLTCRSP